MKLTDITEDEEYSEDTETENPEEGGDEKPARKSSSANAEVRELKSQIANLTRLVTNANTPKGDAAKVTRLETAYENLIKNGYKPDQLEALLEVAHALKEDLSTETKSTSDAQEAKKFYQGCWTRVYDELDKLAEKNEVDEKQFSYARDNLAKRMSEVMAKHDKFSGARDAYAQRIYPDKSDFSAAARMVFETYRKESGMKQSDNRPAQLDLQSSRSKAAPTAKPGEPINLEKLDDAEKEVYLATKNITKNEELARKALARFQGRDRGR